MSPQESSVFKKLPIHIVSSFVCNYKITLPHNFSGHELQENSCIKVQAVSYIFMSNNVNLVTLRYLTCCSSSHQWGFSTFVFVSVHDFDTKGAITLITVACNCDFRSLLNAFIDGIINAPYLTQ